MDIPNKSDKLLKLLNEKKSARDFQQRKHQDWNENYELYRNKVKTNRLTQRQVVNIPLMKETIKTLLSKVDDPPSVEWREKSGDEMKSLIYQEMWDQNARDEDLELKDIVDKKNVFIYGLSTKTLNLHEKGVSIKVEDPFDILFDPLMNPLDVESARFIIKQNIFKSLREVLADDRYSKKGRDELKIWLATDRGIIQSGKNREEFEKRQERLRAMGVQSDKFPTFAGGEAVVNLTEHMTLMWHKDHFERRVMTYADDSIELLDESLIDLMGTDEWPLDMWCDDPETNDVYPDGVADLIRTPNKVVNIWYSQMIENRTLQNFQMHWFDATQQGYQPQQYEPGPGRMLPAPGEPSKTIMPVQVNGLDETMAAIDFITNIVERGTGATAIEKGEHEQGVSTLGETEILVGKATERAKTMAKFYKQSWYRLSKKWDAIMQANDFPEFTLYKTGPSGKMFKKVVYEKDWKSEAGYEPFVASSSEQEADEMKSIQKFSFAIQQSPENAALRRILQQRTLKSLDLSAAELSEIQDEEEKLAEMRQQQAAAANAPKPKTTETSQTAASSPEDVSAEMEELANLMAV